MRLKNTLFLVAKTPGASAIVAAACLAMTSCASIISGQYQPITFYTQPEGALIQINGVPYGKTPTTIPMRRSFSPLVVQYSLDGYETKAVPAPTSFNFVSLLDILFWPSFFVDAATGAMMGYDPTVNQATLDPLPAKPAHP